jgi:catechol 2,3-dioxygenase-like lactoylglutathione lyase family enzyme
MVDTTQAPLLAGVHHVKLPVRDLARSRDWYASRLGFEVAVEFVEKGLLMGYGLRHPDPDGHEIRFYTVLHHTSFDGDVMSMHDPVETAAARERAHATGAPS